MSGGAEPRPAWAFPPERTLGVGVALNVVLARNESAAMLLTHAVAFPDGVVLDVLAVRREAARHVPWDGEGLPPDLAFRSARVGAERFAVRSAEGDLRLTVQGAMSGSWHRDARFYLCPLPPPGPLAITVAWEELGLADTTVEIDAAPLREAAARATTLWEGGAPS